MKAAALASLGFAAFLLAACGGSSKPAATHASAQPVPRLHSIDQLRAAFNAHTSMPQLVVLISPT